LASKKKYSTDGEEYDDYKEIEMTFSTTGHSASLIPVFAYGPGAEEFSGIYDNTAIFNKIMEVTKWE
jgi:alkaline phosphatase